MRPPWWYGVAGATIVWMGVVVAVKTVPESSPLDQQLSGILGLAIFIAWVVMPLSIYLDQRTYSEELAWDPTTALWIIGSLVWIVNIPLGAAYCLRRHVAASRTPPSRHWKSLVTGSVVAWGLLLVPDQVVVGEHVPEAVIAGLAAVVALAWVTLPVALLVEAVRVRDSTDWDPNSRAFVFGATIPFINLVVAAVYLYKRREAFASVDAPREVSRPGNGRENDDAGDAMAIVFDGSPWFRRAGYVFGSHLLVIGVVGAAISSLSETALELLAVVTWIPFGPFFAACVYKDAAWRQERDRSVGDSWWLYLLSALIQGVAFWYLVRRVTKAYRHRNRPTRPTTGSETESGIGTPDDESGNEGSKRPSVYEPTVVGGLRSVPIACTDP